MGRDSGQDPAMRLVAAGVDELVDAGNGAAGVAPRSLRHPSLLGPLLELCPEPAFKGTTKNRADLPAPAHTAATAGPGPPTDPSRRLHLTPEVGGYRPPEVRNVRL